MTDKKWNKPEYDAYKQQFPDAKKQRLFAIEMQTRLVNECNDPKQKERYIRGLKILERERIMKECCLDIWFETNLAIRMVTWEITRPLHGGDKYSQDEMFPISYTCPWCGRKWSNRDNV